MDSPLGRVSPSGELSGFMSGTRLALVLRCAFAMAAQERKDRRLFLRYASRALSRFGPDGLLVLGRRIATLGEAAATASSDSDSDSEEEEQEEIDEDEEFAAGLTPKSKAARALLAEASDSDHSDGATKARADSSGNWSGLSGESQLAIRGGGGSSSSSRRKRRHSKRRSRRRRRDKRS